MKTTAIYHRADFDGIFCREIARKFLPDAELIGWDYGDPKLHFPRSGTVYVLDLSPSVFDPGAAFHSGKDRLVWIDHHRTALEEWPKDIPGYRIDGVAACRLAWQWFLIGEHNEQNRFNPQLIIPLPPKEDFLNDQVSEPYAVKLAGKYDIWDKTDPNAELFQFGLKSRPLNNFSWGQLLDNTVDKVLQGTGMEATGSELFSRVLLEAGHTIKYVRDQEYREVILEQGFTVEFEGMKYLACNSHELDIRSQLFEAGIKPEHDGLLGFTFNGKDWRVSLYHVPHKTDIDHSVIAKKYGGGGHKGACGFRIAKLPFI